ESTGVAPDYFYLRAHNRTFADVAAFQPVTVNWTGVERPEKMDAALVTPSFFAVMGAQPALGRFLTANDQDAGQPVVVLSHAFWRNRLGGDRSVVGKRLYLDRQPRTIVGVMPQGFDLPRGAQMWLPFALDEATNSFPLSITNIIRIVSIVAR